MAIKYAFIGGGNMGQALFSGLISSEKSSISNIVVADPSEKVRNYCKRHLGIRTCVNNQEAISGADVVIFAVKPQHIHSVISELKVEKKPTCLFISIAAGIRLSHLKKLLGANQAIVRCMPNTPALVHSGISVLIATEKTSAEQRSQAENLLQSVGKTLWIEDEALMDAVTAVSGSGPAYFFLLIELIQKAGIRLGLASDISETLAIETAFGAAKLAQQSPDTPSELRQKVTSPQGTTDAALNVFLSSGLEDIVNLAITAAYDRSIALSKEN
jgi:pyrroline-5-carboxylate reductase